MAVPRSLLFVPGDRPERFDKAAASGAGLVVLDLEDDVRPGAKEEARRNVGEWLAAGNRAAVRVNGIDTTWHAKDAAVLRAPGVCAVMLPKAEDASAIERFGSSLPDGVPIIALVETALGVWNARDVAEVAKVSRLAFGSADFQLDCGVDKGGDALLYARSRLVIASTIARIAPPVDGVTIGLDDAELLKADIAHARALGFGGKLCIHPAQIGPVNAGFQPDEETLAWAQRVVDAAAEQKAGAIRLDGKLVDRALVNWATRLLSNRA